MPYCTIEEAWANSLTQEELKPYTENEYELTLTGVDHKPYAKVQNHPSANNILLDHIGPKPTPKPRPIKKIDVVVDSDSDSDSDSLFEKSSSDDESVNNASEKFKNEDNELKKLIKENKNLKKLIRNLQKNRPSNNNSNKDFALYVFSGLVVILILENFRKIYKRF